MTGSPRNGACLLSGLQLEKSAGKSLNFVKFDPPRPNFSPGGVDCCRIWGYTIYNGNIDKNKIFATIPLFSSILPVQARVKPQLKKNGAGAEFRPIFGFARRPSSSWQGLKSTHRIGAGVPVGKQA
jgi:hypothetical protein